MIIKKRKEEDIYIEDIELLLKTDDSLTRVLLDEDESKKYLKKIVGTYDIDYTLSGESICLGDGDEFVGSILIEDTYSINSLEFLSSVWDSFKDAIDEVMLSTETRGYDVKKIIFTTLKDNLDLLDVSVILTKNSCPGVVGRFSFGLEEEPYFMGIISPELCNEKDISLSSDIIERLESCVSLVVRYCDDLYKAGAPISMVKFLKENIGLGRVVAGLRLNSSNDDDVFVEKGSGVKIYPQLGKYGDDLFTLDIFLE